MQDRWVSYIFRYKDYKKCENAGFVKLIRTSKGNVEQAKVEIGLKLCKPLMCRCRVYFIYDERELVLMEELLIKPEERDVISFKKLFNWRNFLKDGCTPKDFDGVLFAVDDGDTLMSLWVEKDIKIQNLQVATLEEPEEATEKVEVVTIQEESKDIEKIDIIPMPEYLKKYEMDEEPKEELKPSKEPEDEIEELLKNGFKLPLFMDSSFTDCIKIVPQDIGKLPMVNWKLGQNSFLTHGYYRYKYIMLGKVNYNGQETLVLGVPGVYTNKEKYLANMFGFSLFIPVKKADRKTGCFGYWVWEVMRQ